MRPLDGYPTSFGSSRAAVFPHEGPDDYTVISDQDAGELGGGGDVVQAVECGLKCFDIVLGGLADSGAFYVIAMPTSLSGFPDTPTKLGQPTTTYRLKWMVATTGVEVAAHTDLTGEIVRLFALGPK